jgi:hypothetical protein
LNTKFSLLFLMMLALLLMFHQAAPALVMANNTLVQELDTGRIDWSAGTVRATGFSAPATDEDDRASDSPSNIVAAARRMAQSNLLDTVGAIRIDAGSRVADIVAQSAAFRDGLNSLVRNAVITRQEYLSDGTLEIELTMTLTGGFSQFVLPEEIRQVDSVTPMKTVDPSLETHTGREGGNDRGPHTGLILDATGIDAKPSLVPIVVDESEEVVYGPAFVSREYAVSRGMSGFAATLAVSRDDKRVGDRPMVVKAIRTHSTGETDLVISSADAARLRSSVVHLNFLKACRVSIVMDSEAAP